MPAASWVVKRALVSPQAAASARAAVRLSSLKSMPVNRLAGNARAIRLMA